MSKALLMTLSLWLGALALQAQNQPISIEWGKANKNQSTISRILGEAGEEVVILATKNKDFFIETYDKNSLSLKESNPMPLPKEEGKETQIEHIHFFSSTKKIVLFTSLYEKKHYRIYQYEVGLDGTVSKSKTLVDIEVDNINRKGDFGFEPSVDQEFLLIYHSSELRKEKSKQAQVFVMDNTGSIQSEIKSKIPNKEGKAKLYVSRFAYDGEQFVHMLVSKVSYPGTAKQVVDFYIYSYDLTQNNSRQIQKIELDADHMVLDLAFTINPANELVLAGFYADYAGMFMGLLNQGTFTMIYDPKTKQQRAKKLDDYTQADYEHAYGKRAKAYKNGFPPRYRIQEIVLDENGGIFLISEYYYAAQSRGTTSFIYGDILVTRLDNTGKIQWLSSVPKTQMFTRLGMMPITSYGGLTIDFSFYIMRDKSVYLSYLFSVQNGQLYFLYNDNPKNITTDISEKPKPLRVVEKGVPTLVVMDGDGEMKREVVYGAKNDELTLRPRISNRVDERTIYIYGNKKKLDKLGRLTFN